MTIEKIIIVTRKTRRQELIERFNTRSQAKFYIEHAGGDFSEYEAEDASYQRALDTIAASLAPYRTQIIDRSFTPTFVFAEDELIVTVGQDGLVANTAKYVRGLPIIAINPDPARFDGVLLPFVADEITSAVKATELGNARMRSITLASVALNDGQTLLAFNDFFIGARSHVSARYRIEFRGASATHSSSGIIVSTGAGSTGWMSSLFNMAEEVSEFAGGTANSSRPVMAWESDQLVFVVREPFASRTSSTDIAAGTIAAGEQLLVESRMAQEGVIFSDGVEKDFIAFNSGAFATIGVAKEKAKLVVK